MLINGDVSDIPYKKIVSSLDTVEEKQNNNATHKNKWCCFSIRLPATAKLEKKTLTFIILILLIDALVNLLLFFTNHHWWFLNGHSFAYFTWNDLYHDFSSFHNGTSDTMLLFLLRALLLFILSCIAITKGVPQELWNENAPNLCCCSLSRCCHRKKAVSTSKKVKKIANNAAEEDDEEYIEIEGIVDKSALQPKFDDCEEEESYLKRKKKCVIYKYGTLLFMFILCTLFQCYIGVKCIRFHFDDKTEILEAVFYGISILCINIEIFLFKKFVESATDLGDAIIIKSIHRDPLRFMRKVNFWCDLCRGRTKYGSYRCDQCNFDLCRVCFKKEKKKLLQKQQKKQALQKQASMQHGGKLADNININAAIQSYQYSNAKYQPENDPTSQIQKEMTTSQYMIRALKLMTPHCALVSVAMLCLVITCGATILLPRSQGSILDKINTGDRAAFIYQIKYYLILSVVIGLFGSIRNLCFSFISRRLTVSIRSSMFRNIMIQDIEFFDDMSTGELISRMTNDVNGMLTPLRVMLASTLSNVLLLFGGIIMIFLTSWRLSMLAFTTMAPIVFLMGEYAKWSKGINISIWAAFASSTSIAQQAFSNIRTVRAFGTERKETRNYDNALQEILERGLVNAIASTVTFAVTNYLDLGAGVLILWYGGMSIFGEDNTELTVGKLITFQLYWNMINNAYKQLQNVLTTFTRSAGGAQRVLSLLDDLSKHNSNLYKGLEPEKGILDGNISVNNVHFTYKSRPTQSVLNGVNLEIKPGEIVAIVGKSGGGKTTLINLLMRFYDVNGGDILYNEAMLPLNEMNLTKLRHNIGLVSQDNQLFDTTISENITYGVCDREFSDIPLNEIIYYAKLANCHEFIDKFEEKYETRIGERGVKLSGGQKQRIAIARMLMKKPKILFLDEATSNLDTESEALVQSAIDKTIWYNDEEEKYDDNEDKQWKFKANAVILVAHRLSTVINADKIAVVDNGKIVEIGNHNQLLQIENGIYHKLVQRQIQREKNELTEKQQLAIADKSKAEKPKTNVSIDNIDSLFD